MGNSFAIEKRGFQVLAQLVCLLNLATSIRSLCPFSESDPISSTATNVSDSRFSGATEQFLFNLNNVHVYAAVDEDLILHLACVVNPKLPQRTLGKVNTIILFNGTSIHENGSFSPFDMTCTPTGVSLLFQNVQKNDAGNITHIVYINGTFLLARSIFFNVISKPLRTPYRVFTGETISLRCPVNTSNVRWNFVTGPNSVYVGSGGTLRIENASKEHSGLYKCSVSRPEGQPIVYAEKQVEVVAEGNATFGPTVGSSTTSASANNTTRPTSAFTMQSVTSTSPTSSPRSGESSDSNLALKLALPLVLGVAAVAIIFVAALAVKKRFSRCDRSFSPDPNGPASDDPTNPASAPTRPDDTPVVQAVKKVMKEELQQAKEELQLTIMQEADNGREETRKQGEYSRKCTKEIGDAIEDKK